ncbi:hypothetical protein [Streptomyces sp. NPDC021212]|uniref:hypothetical protein n=1 Tax=Streptomyces sp. NPDC021212 TaxID=3365118 RepID=UPI0037B721E8
MSPAIDAAVPMAFFTGMAESGRETARVGPAAGTITDRRHLQRRRVAQCASAWSRID